MLNKWVIVFSVLLFYSSVRSTQDEWEGGENLNRPTVKSRLECNVTFCDLPCPRTAPPPYCLQNLPTCASGCTCMNSCETNSVICFMSDHCKDYRRFLKKQPFVPRVTPENPNYYQF